jgi:RNA polymerase sigma-70 factor (ECF subfamily)
LLRRACIGDEQARNELFARYRRRLLRMIRFRLNRRLLRRIDPQEVLQDAYLEASRRLPEYLTGPHVPFFLWLRQIVGQQLLQVHRQHLGARMRDVGGRQPPTRAPTPEAPAASPATDLVGRLTSPDQAAMCAEAKVRLREALNCMEPMDREVLALRHFEQLTNAEAAQALGLAESVASRRYVRALERLSQILSDVSGSREQSPASW